MFIVLLDKRLKSTVNQSLNIMLMINPICCDRHVGLWLSHFTSATNCYESLKRVSKLFCASEMFYLWSL